MKTPTTTEEALKEMTYTTDGPLTCFVVLMRGMRLVAAGADPEIIGNAYAEWMETYTRVNMNE